MSKTDQELINRELADLYKNRKQGVIIRSIASFGMWLFALLAYWINEIQITHFIGISSSVLFLVLIMPLSLFIFKRITNQNTYFYISVFNNLLVVLGFTGVIYSLGGLEATYLTPIYAAFITYWGVMESKKTPYIIASFCTFTFVTMVVLQGLDIIPSLNVDANFNPSFWAVLIRVLVIIALLYIVAYIASFTAGKIKQTNKELQNAINEIKALKGIIPICSYCHNIRDNEGAWNMLEEYISKHSNAEFSHGICPSCLTVEREKLQN